MISRVAILKPDHFGDLVLASPAIRAISLRCPDATLFVNSGTERLARYLFGDALEIRCLDFAHLSRHPTEPTNSVRAARELDRFSMVFCLRDDPVMRAVLDNVAVPSRIISGSHLVHETASHKRALVDTIGDYSRTKMFAGSPIFWPNAPAKIALCIAAGFPTNRWPNACWIDLADRLNRKGISIVLVGGPGEREDLRILSRLLPRVPHQVVEGGDDFDAFLAALEDVDLVIATDGGTAHICSLRKPICSIFGSSPWRRYAPFGRDNVLATRDEPCSPCVQFSPDILNGCLTRECMAALPPRQVARIALSNGLDFSGINGLRVERGVSHRQYEN